MIPVSQEYDLFMARLPGRTFRLRLRPGRAVLSARSDGLPDEAAEAGEEIVLPEAEAAFLVRKRVVDIIEVIDAPSDEPKPDRPD